MNVTLKSKNNPKIGVDELWFAKLVKDIAGEEPEYDVPMKMPGAVSVAFNPNSQSAPFYADNVVYASAAQTGDLTATLGIADAPPEVRAIWFGLQYENGVLLEGQINPPDMAFAYRVKKSDNAYRYFWLMKSKASPPSETINTQGSSMSYQTDSVTVNCAVLQSLGIYRRVLDDDDPNLPEGTTPAMIYENWFTSPLWEPEVMA